MKIGLHFGPVVLAGYDMQQQWEEHLREVLAARDAGFECISIGNHFVIHPFQYFSTYPHLARLAALVPDMTVVSAVILVPLGHPVDIARQVATLDVITEGQFRFGCGLGYRPVEFDIFGTSLRDRGARFEESLHVMRRLWSEESVSYDGRFFHLDSVELGVHPMQRPNPPIWLATNSEAATRRAAELADAPFWSPFLGGDALRRHDAIYRDLLATQGRPVPSEIPIIREYSIGRTRSQALEDGREGVMRKWKAYADHGLQESLSTRDNRLLGDFEEISKENFILGDPAECASEIQRYGDELGITHMFLRLGYPSMPHEKVMERIELTGQVIRLLK